MNDSINNTLPMITTWYGRNVAEMSHEEILEAFNELGRMYQKQIDRENERAEKSVKDMYALAARRNNG